MTRTTKKANDKSSDKLQLEQAYHMNGAVNNHARLVTQSPTKIQHMRVGSVNGWPNRDLKKDSAE